MVKSGVRSERTSTATLDRGLYIFRYKSASSQSEPPLVYLRPSYGSENALKFISVPGSSETTLTHPGTALVISVDATAGLQITLQAVGSSAPEADVSLEPLITAPRFAPPVSETFSVPPDRAAPTALQLIGHVARRGDVAVSAGKWVAGPDSPAPIEGVGIAWQAGQGHGLEYQVLAQGASGWSDWVGCGRFAGSRGEARPLVGVRFRLAEGPAKPHLRGAALFLGSSIVERSGRAIELRSVAGFDPLVGLFLDIVEEAVSVQPPMSPPQSSPDDVSKPPKAGRVRVFRAGGEQKR